MFSSSVQSLQDCTEFILLNFPLQQAILNHPKIVNNHPISLFHRQRRTTTDNNISEIPTYTTKQYTTHTEASSHLHCTIYNIINKRQHQQKTASTKEKLQRHRRVPDLDGAGGIGGGDPLAVGGETRDGGRGGGDPLAVGGETCDGGRGGGDPLAVGGEKRDGGRLGFSDLGFHGATTMIVDDDNNGYEGESGKDEGRSERHRRRTRRGDVGGGNPVGEQQWWRQRLSSSAKKKNRRSSEHKQALSER
ncbi:hypothetical protein LR48_Vigan10g063900 [Vigna angularis]|uniref:Uncharacterized protein n=1 Tax=Phaseolus angularis TaxID=3914 RepID=A0A0L9VIL1_PHAAN|nr:hypothetical protein LR48_Vigan10g063900 [Vigna angularis]